ncbi:TPA: hypothetical protein SMI10_003177 [Serratia liquefaciens]|nr:hypothetical protein [Serratia liquefaciens]
MSTEKLSELSKPVATVDVQRGRNDGNMFAVAWSSAGHALPDGPHFLYSQEYVSALLADLEFEKQNNAGIAGMVEDYETKLEAKDKRIAELERANQSQDDHINQQQDRIDSLEKTNTGLGQRLGAAEKRLASPIKIVNYDEFFICHVTGASDDYCKGLVDGRNAAARDVGKAGFTVEGDE